MTRRGSLVYYLSAWVFGCFFTSVMVGFFGSEHAIRFTRYPQPEPVQDFIRVFLMLLVTGGANALAFGFVLRWPMVRFKCLNAAQWIVAGAVISLPLVYSLAKLGPLIPRRDFKDPPWVVVAQMIVFAGPYIVTENGPLLVIPAGAMTAYVLFLVHRAFNAPQVSAA